MAEPAGLAKLINEAASGNTAAAYFLASVYHAIGVWDNLIDKDEKVSDEDIHTVFEFFLIHLPENPWYRASMDKIQPVMQAFIINWHSGNAMKATNPEQTYILRQLFFDLVTLVAKLTGGIAHAKKLNLALWQGTAKFMTLEQYKDKDHV